MIERYYDITKNPKISNSYFDGYTKNIRLFVIPLPPYTKLVLKLTALWKSTNNPSHLQGMNELEEIKI